jgi:hypothetical protein
METPKGTAKMNAGLVDDHDPSAIGRKQDKQKPQWLQKESRSAAEEKVEPTEAEKLDDNPSDARSRF